MYRHKIARLHKPATNLGTEGCQSKLYHRKKRQARGGAGLAAVGLLVLAMSGIVDAACSTNRCKDLKSYTATKSMPVLLQNWSSICHTNYVDTFGWQNSSNGTSNHHQASDRGEAYNNEIRLFLTHSENEGHVQMFQAKGTSHVGSNGMLLGYASGARPFLSNYKFESPPVGHPADMGVIQFTPRLTEGNAAGLVAVVSKDVNYAVDFFSYDFNTTTLTHVGEFPQSWGVTADKTETAAMTYYNGEVLLFLGGFAKNCGENYYKFYRADPMALFENLDTDTPMAGVHASDGLYLMGAQSGSSGDNDKIGAYKVSVNTNGNYYLSTFSGNYAAHGTKANGRDGPYLHVLSDGTVVHGGSVRIPAHHEHPFWNIVNTRSGLS